MNLSPLTITWFSCDHCHDVRQITTPTKPGEICGRCAVGAYRLHSATFTAGAGAIAEAAIRPPCKTEAVAAALHTLVPEKYVADRLIAQYIRELQAENAALRGAR